MMKDYQIDDMNLVQQYNDIKVVQGLDAKKQSILLRLSIRRGSFLYDEKLGSRLYLTYKEKKSKQLDIAKFYVYEALEDEEDIEIVDVVPEWLDYTKKRMKVTVYFKWLGLEANVIKEVV